MVLAESESQGLNRTLKVGIGNLSLRPNRKFKTERWIGNTSGPESETYELALNRKLMVDPWIGNLRAPRIGNLNISPNRKLKA